MGRAVFPPLQNCAKIRASSVREVLNVKKTTTSIHSRIDAMRSTIDDLERSLDEKQEAIHVARRQLQGWRRELDAGESWPDAPLSTFSAG
jgi:chromosome segregation ATPase